MRHIFTIVLFLFSTNGFGQTTNRFSLALRLQPELTFHKNNYAYRWKETYTKTTFNTGIAAALQYDLTNRWFAEAGLGYISRKLNTTVFLNQAALPPPRQSSTLELVNTESVAFRTLELPVAIGYRVIKKQKSSLFLNAGFSGNFLLNTYYEVGFKQYEGSYAKNYWQGYSLHAGIGADHTISKKITVTAGVNYSLVNAVREDEYLFSQDEHVIALPHTFLRFYIGVRAPY